MIDFNITKAAVFRRSLMGLKPIIDIDYVNLDDLVGISSQKSKLIENTQKFINSKQAHHVILWGAGGCGKSSLAKAVFNKFFDYGLRVIEIYKDDLEFLHDTLDTIRTLPYKFIIFCDDLSFEKNDLSYKFLKPLLEGSLERPPNNVLMYITSNRRHLIAEYQDENGAFIDDNNSLHYGDTVEEKLSLFERFGLSIGFYRINLNGYFMIIEKYFGFINDDIKVAARQFCAGKVNLSPRLAKQFFITYKDKFGNFN